MKNKIRLICLILSLVLFSSVLVGCQRQSSHKKINTNQTQLYIGLGTNGIKGWADVAIKKFEEKYAETVFEEGKKGVQIFCDFNEKFQNWDTLPINYTGYQEKLIITESIPYSKVKKMALDITDLVKEECYTGATYKSIESKMKEPFKSYYSKDGHYYAIPAQQSTNGIVYDIDLFDEYGLYFANNTTENFYEYECLNDYTKKETTYKFVDGEWTDEDKSAGADGILGTYDDGLPATYEEFFALCNYMKLEFGFDPIRWAGKVQAYFMGVISSLAIDFEGKDFDLSINFNGTDDNLVKFDENGKIQFNEDGSVVTYSSPITDRDGYKIVDQEGYYYALKFMETLLNSNYYNKDLCLQGTEDHLTTQSKYLLSKKDTKTSTIAMLLEGSWWQGEASRTFEDMASKYGEEWSSKNRNFGFMPLPKVSEKYVGAKSYTENSLEMVTFVTNDISETQKQVAKLFIKEMYSDEGLYDFIDVTGQVRPFELNLSNQQYDALTGFGKSNYNIGNNTNICLKASYSPIFELNNGLFTSVWSLHWQSNLGDNPIEIMSSTKTGADKIFEEVHKYWNKDRWDLYFSSLYE